MEMGAVWPAARLRTLGISCRTSEGVAATRLTRSATVKQHAYMRDMIASLSSNVLSECVLHVCNLIISIVRDAG